MAFKINYNVANIIILRQTHNYLYIFDMVDKEKLQTAVCEFNKITKLARLETTNTMRPSTPPMEYFLHICPLHLMITEKTRKRQKCSRIMFLVLQSPIFWK